MDPATRYRVMSSIKKRDTKPEVVLRKALWEAGLRGWRCHAPLPGTPDLAFTRWKLAVMVDGVWWHGHADHRPTQRHGEYWHAKIQRNIERDRRVEAELQALGWDVLRLWDLDVLADPAGAAEFVAVRLADRQIAG